MPVVFVTTLALIALASWVRHLYSLPQTSMSALLLLMAVLIYAAARGLHFRYLRRTAAELTASPSAPGARHHVPGVPRWATELTNVAFGAALAALVPLVESLVP